MVFPHKRNSLMCVALIYRNYYVIFNTIHTRENGPFFQVKGT